MSRTEWAREFFKNDRFATKTTGIEIIEAGDNYAKCELRPTPDHMNAAGGVMGGAIFTLADFCFAVAANTKERLAVSLTSEISYISKARGSLLIAEAKCLKTGRTACFYTIEIKDDLDNLVANVSVNGLFV